MGFIENNLMPGEEILLRGKIHWGVVLLPVARGITGTLMAAGSAGLFFTLQGGSLDGGAMGIAAMLIGVALGLGGLYNMFVAFFGVLGGFTSLASDRVVITDRRIMGRFGVLGRTTGEFEHTKIESIRIEQSLPERIVGGAWVDIKAIGGAWVKTPLISNYGEFRRTALAQMEKKAVLDVRVIERRVEDEGI